MSDRSCRKFHEEHFRPQQFFFRPHRLRDIRQKHEFGGIWGGTAYLAQGVGRDFKYVVSDTKTRFFHQSPAVTPKMQGPMFFTTWTNWIFAICLLSVNIQIVYDSRAPY